MTRRVRMIVLTSLVALSVVAFGAFATLYTSGFSAHAANPLPLAFTQQRFNGLDPIIESGEGGPASLGDLKNPPSPVCANPTSVAANVNTDCELSPHNETSIAVNPTNPANLVGGANDYQLILTSGGTLKETIFTRAHVTFDGGKTWTDYPITTPQYVATGDPAVAFDAKGTAYLATLGFLFSQGRSPSETAPDVIVSHSTDGGKTWAGPVRVATGTGLLTSVSTFNDKEYITAWGNGNAIVTWTVFHLGSGGVTINSPIFDVVTHDGGNTWTAPTEISGSAPFCVGALPSNPTACDQDQFSVPTVAADGSIYVAFESLANAANGRDQYLVVKVDPSTGQRVAGPHLVAGLIDGITDYPIDDRGRQTYQDSEFRTNSAGNITADPTTAGHLAVVFSDMRNSTLPAPSDPYSATTNSDVGVSQSFDGGVTWSAPTMITAPGDQFMPWGAYDASGKLRIGYFDRSYDPANHEYGYTLAIETAPGSLTFTTTQVTTTLSDPTKNDRWFSGGPPPHVGFPHPTRFLGDYSGIAISPTGVATLWTDMRNTACFTVRCGAGEDAFYATAS
jgi:hypothetical protein